MSDAKKKSYAIGYKKPPQGKKFAKGQSGNPAGRPRKSTMDEIPASTRSLFLDIMQRKVSIREGEEIKKISTKEAVLRAHVTTAMKGNALAQRDVTQFAMRCEKDAEKAHWEKYHCWTEYKEKYTALIARGHPADDILPHPDDVILHDDGNVTFDGPVGKAHEAAIKNVMAIREAFLIRGVLDERQLEPKNREDMLQTMSALILPMMIFDHSLPPRFRWTDDEHLGKLMFYNALTKRSLIGKLNEVIEHAPDAALILKFPIVSLRALMARGGCEAIEEYVADLRTEALRELDMT